MSSSLEGQEMATRFQSGGVRGAYTKTLKMPALGMLEAACPSPSYPSHA